MKHYSYAIIELCDECRLEMHKTPDIANDFAIKDVGNGKQNLCVICGRINVFSMHVLTNYFVVPEAHETLDSLEPIPRTLRDGFARLWLEDNHASIERDQHQGT